MNTDRAERLLYLNNERCTKSVERLFPKGECEGHMFQLHGKLADIGPYITLL